MLRATLYIRVIQTKGNKMSVAVEPFDINGLEIISCTKIGVVSETN